MPRPFDWQSCLWAKTFQHCNVQWNKPCLDHQILGTGRTVQHPYTVWLFRHCYEDLKFLPVCSGSNSNVRALVLFMVALVIGYPRSFHIFSGIACKLCNYPNCPTLVLDMRVQSFLSWHLPFNIIKSSALKDHNLQKFVVITFYLLLLYCFINTIVLIQTSSTLC
jgi:hypothetical protein